MAEKKRKKESKKKDRNISVPPAKESEKGSAEKNDDRPDYGGLPDRDLKKNLGCG